MKHAGVEDHSHALHRSGSPIRVLVCNVNEKLSRLSELRNGRSDNGSAIDQCYGLSSCQDFLRGPASPQTPNSGRQDHQYHSTRFGHNEREQEGHLEVRRRGEIAITEYLTLAVFANGSS